MLVACVCNIDGFIPIYMYYSAFLLEVLNNAI